MRWLSLCLSPVSRRTQIFTPRRPVKRSSHSGITNEETSSLTRLVDEVFLVHAGREKSVAATKTYTGQLLNALLAGLCTRRARFPPRSLERLPVLADRALGVKQKVAALSERYRFMKQAVVVGRGLNYANAFELSLKMMETCYVVAERFSGADFLHWPIALVERAFSVLSRAARADTRYHTRYLAPPSARSKPRPSSSDRARPRGAAFSNPNDHGSLNGSGPRQLSGRSAHSVPYIIPAQMFCAFLAEQKGLDPDRPRTLTKITQTI